MRNKIILSIFLLFATFFGFLIFNDKGQEEKEEIENFLQFNESSKPIKIAVCKTYHQIAEKLDSSQYEVVKTSSTAQSISLLKNGVVDMIISGRTLKPGEQASDQLIIKDGYSFLSDKETTLYSDDLKKYKIFTDLEAEKIKKIFPVNEIIEVNDIYSHLGQGILITSWENTDYSRAQIVHLLEKNGQRVTLSRRPTVYCHDSCKKEATKNLVYLLAEK